jgi:hypothetical protein
MTRHRQHQVDQETVERLLDGTAVDRRGVPQDLVRLLDAVRAAPLPDELRGEQAAVRAFHTARLAPARPPSARPVRRGVVTWLLPAKTAVAALAVAATGGVALAAVQGVLPHPLRPASPATTTPTGGPTTGGGPDRFGASPSGGEQPAPALVESCRSWRGARAADPDGALRDRAFAPLVRAAGGRDRVDDWCDTVLGRTPGAEPSPRTPGARPTTGPGSAPTSRATPGRPGGSLPVPTVRPGIPTTHPTVSPLPSPGGLTGQVAPTIRPPWRAGAEPDPAGG